MTPNQYLWAQARDRYNSWLYYKKWNPDEEE